MKFNFNNVDKNNSDDNYLNEINRNLEIINKNYNKKFRNNTMNTNFNSSIIEKYKPEDPAYAASTSSRNKGKEKITEFENFDKK